jgi:hypothetical protein
MQAGLTTIEEVAEIIFNSTDSELNDMLQKARARNYEIDQLIRRISADINAYHRLDLENSSTARNRKEYLFGLIKSELSYYGAFYDK